MKSLLWQFAVGSLVVTIIIGVALGWVLGEVIQRHAIAELMEEARANAGQKILTLLSPEDLRGPMSAERYAQFQQFIDSSVISYQTARVKVWNSRGVVIYSDEPSQVGHTFPIEDHLAAALAGGLAGELSELQAVENVAERSFGKLLEVYVPLLFPGSSEVAGAFEIYQYYDHTARFIEQAQRYTYGGLAIGLALLYLSLFAIVKRGADTIAQQQVDLKLRALDLEKSYDDTLDALCASLDLRDRETEGHSRRVSQLTVALAKEMGVPQEELKAIEYGALLHDIGKIGISDTILLKPGSLSDDEWLQMRRHSYLGYKMLSRIQFLSGAADMVHAHHERNDGKGYPSGLAGEAIPLGARIFTVVDTYDAMTSDRPYRKALSHEEALEEIRRNSGTQFDPKVVEVFLRMAD
ncbi:MAG: HD-GYP domain-containing protein [Chloroflexi bacterium]|nr:HD-GYP domain-containing protein [Chloroflexota bacterium]